MVRKDVAISNQILDQKLHSFYGSLVVTMASAYEKADVEGADEERLRLQNGRKAPSLNASSIFYK